jgi:hypothetical protein
MGAAAMGAAATAPHGGSSESVIAHAIIQRVAHSERRSTILSLRRSVVGRPVGPARSARAELGAIRVTRVANASEIYRSLSAGSILQGLSLPGAGSLRQFFRLIVIWDNPS